MKKTPPAPKDRKPWVPPSVEDLPRLNDLTLQTGGGIPGECDIVSCF